MEATYCVGNDVDVCRMFDQYLYKRSENVDLSLSIPQSNFQSNGYEMNDQTFHTPSFGDEEFDIPAINPQQQQAQQQQQQQGHQGHQGHGDQQQHYQPPMQGMQQMSQQMNQQQDAMGMHDPTGGYQQPLYLSGPDHGMVNPSYHSPQSNYSMNQQQQQHNNQLLMIQQQQQHQQMMMNHGQPPPGSMGGYGASPQHPQGRGNSPPAAPGQEHTTSDDSDDSTPHPAMMTAMKRPSPEPADQTITKAQKKPKVQKKKKKRDPNEPQKPVSAYALFFRDTQAAIKGQNPNASFGEVSKIVASMWDALDSEHKNVYKKKTEAAKKEYLKALAAYRASLVSKGAGEGDGMYGNYSNYTPNNPQYGGYNPQGRTIPSPPMPQAPTPPSNQQGGPMVKKSPGMMGPGGPMNPGQQGSHQGMMPSPMGPVPAHMGMGHMQQSPHGSYMQQPHQPPHMPVSPQQQHVPHSPQQHVPVSPHMQHMSPPPMVSSSPPVSAPSPAIPTSVAQQQNMAAQVAAHQQQQHQQQQQQQQAAAAAHHQAQAQAAAAQQGQMGPGGRANSCIRHGCPNSAITNPEWEDEYCSNECVVSHCRDVFTNWVASNKNQSQNFSTVK